MQTSSVDLVFDYIQFSKQFSSMLMLYGTASLMRTLSVRNEKE